MSAPRDHHPMARPETPGVTAIIPARLGSTRFPGKVLAADTGHPLIRHVWESASRARCLTRVVVATDDDAVRAACDAFGAACVMTSRDHPNGTSRLAEAAGVLGLGDDHVVVNVQGDEPELDAGLIDAAVEALLSAGRGGAGEAAQVGTVASPLSPGQRHDDPNLVKVALRLDGTALYFSRAPIPFPRDAGAGAACAAPLRHVGLYAYRAGFLRRYAALPVTALEQTEQLEQLRVLAHGYRIAVAVRESSHEGIDTPEQYRRFVERWKARAGA